MPMRCLGFVFLFHSQLFIWQAHNALFMIRCLLKVFIREMSEAELHQQFSYQERAPGSCGGELQYLFHRQGHRLHKSQLEKILLKKKQRCSLRISSNVENFLSFLHLSAPYAKRHVIC